MKKNKASIGIVIVLLLISAIFFFREEKTTLKEELSNFAVKDTSSITMIFLSTQNGKNVTLKRINESKWTVNDLYTARQDGINNLLETMYRVSVKTPVNKAAFENIVKKIASSGTKVEIYKNDNKVPDKVYYVGGTNQEHTGTEMLMDNSSVPFYTHVEGFYGFLTPRYITNANEWRDRTIFNSGFGSITSLQVEHPMDPEQSFKIIDVGNGQFALSNLKTREELSDFDTLSVKDYLNQFQNVHYESFEETKTKEYISSILQTTPQQVYTVTDVTGIEKTCKTYLKPVKDGATDLEGNPINFDLDRMYATINDTDFVVVQHIIFDKLDKKLDDLKKPS